MDSFLSAPWLSIFNLLAALTLPANSNFKDMVVK
jgi:hypothetical protein